MNYPIISIIVPIYKVEQYLPKCIDSILNQTFSDFELLLIDDGSPDKSGNICDEYAKQDNRIRVFHKKNGGVSSARQCGIDYAVGEYTIHVDPDDWIEPNMLQELYIKAKEEDADMVICDYFVDFSNTGKSSYIKQQPASENSNDLLKELFTNLHGNCWNKLIKRSTSLKYGAYFPKGINYCEDVCFNVQLFMHSIKVSYLPKAFYHYIQVPTSITNNFSKQKLETCKKYVEWLCNILPDSSFEVMKAKEMVKMNAVNFAILSNTEIKELYPEIKKSSATNLYTRLTYNLAFQGYQHSARFIIYLIKLIIKLRDNIFR